MAPQKRTRISDQPEVASSETGSGGGGGDSVCGSTHSSEGATPKFARKSFPKDDSIFKKSDEVYCSFSNRLYLAVIKDVQPFKDVQATANVRSLLGRIRGLPDTYAYFVHYIKWGSKWDEWVRVDCLKPVTEETTKEHLELKKLANKEKKPKGGYKGKKRRSANSKRLSKSFEGKPFELDGSRDETSNEKMDDDDALQSCNDEEVIDEPSKFKTEEVECNEEEADESGYVGDLDCSIDDELVPTNPAEMSEALSELISLKKNEAELEMVESDCETEPGDTVDPLYLDIGPIQSSTENDEEVVVKHAENVMNPTPPETAVNWDSNASPCAIVATPTICDISSDLCEYLKSGTNGKLAAPFIEKLLATFEIFCQSLPAGEKESCEKVMAEREVKRFSDVVHCGGLARLIEIIKSKAPNQQASMNQDTPVGDLPEEAEDIEAILTVCKDYFWATERYFEEKFGFKFQA